MLKLSKDRVKARSIVGPLATNGCLETQVVEKGIPPFSINRYSDWDALKENFNDLLNLNETLKTGDDIDLAVNS